MSCQRDVYDATFTGAHRYIYLTWLPQSEYRQKNTLTFELYIKTPIEEDYNNLLTEIYIPIEKTTKK
ncbi:GyrI-like domain-containing protein [Parabacteroides gordonii]|uniref:GyrI-like domain-containing protein n=1 Tax=Parabacteroides gordonii TaxID=574930 RepID=UPI0009DC3C80|nr:GyrI-like domain-containing protein [Parabacteroides gordonii]